MNVEAAHLANSKSKEGIPFGPDNGFVPEGMPVFGLRNNSQIHVVNRIRTTTATVFAILMFEGSRTFVE
jgi:hypothetical protein